MAATEPSDTNAREIVAALPVMRLLPAELRQVVVETFEERSFGFGDYIVVEGEEADAFFVLIEGLARVVGIRPEGGEVSLDLIRPGDTFGERALLEARPRARSVRASSPVAVARMDATVFRSLTRVYPQVRAAFEAQARARRLRGMLRMLPAFSVLGSDAVALMLRDGAQRQVRAGQQLVGEGDPANSWWIVEDGRLTVYTTSPTRRDLRFLRNGDLFGELALLQGRARSANVEATTDAVLLEFPESTLRKLLEDPAFRKRIDERLLIYERGPGRRPLEFGPVRDDGTQAELRAPLPRDDNGDIARITAGVDLAEISDEAPGWTPPRRFPLVHQIDDSDSGAASVAMLCRAFGHRVSITYIRDAIRAGGQGTTLAGIRRGGKEIGLEVRAIKSSAARVRSVPLPAIVHWEGKHWVVLFGVEENFVRIADPRGRLQRVSHEELADKWSGYAATARPTPRLAQAPREQLQVRWLLPFLEPQRKRVAIAIVLSLLATASAMVPPILSQHVIDAVVRREGSGRVNLLVAIMIAVLVLSLGVSLLERRVLARLAVELDSDSLDFVTGRLLALPLAYFQSRRTGDISRRLNALRYLRQTMVQNLPRVLAGLAQLVVTLVIMFTYSWVLGVAFLATAPIYALLMRYSAKLLKPTFDELEEAYGRHASQQIDAIRGIEAIKTAGAEIPTRANILQEFKRLAHTVFKGDFVMMSYEAAVQLASFLIFVAFLWIAALLAISGSLSVGQVVAINSVVLLANGPIVVLLGFWDQVQVAAVILQRLHDVIEQEPEQSEAALKPVPTLEGRITLRGVGLAYRNAPDKPVLDEVSLELQPGMSLGLVGRSGSGKSSLLRCLWMAPGFRST